jgi:hypothetical protein
MENLNRRGQMSKQAREPARRPIQELSVHLDAAFERGEISVCELLIERIYEIVDELSDN